MISLPRKQSETGIFKDVWRAINDLREYVRQITPIAGINVQVDQTPNGSMIRTRATAAQEPATPIQWRGEWRSTENYLENDIVIRGSANVSSASWNDTAAILADGFKAGVFIARRDVASGQPAPVEPDGSGNWETLARFATPIFVVRQPGQTSTILLDSQSPNGVISIKLADCNGKTLTVREVAVCVNGIERKMMVLGSAPY